MQFTKQMTNAMLRDYADVLDTYIYRMGISLGRFSFGTAGGLFKSIINFALLCLANKIADMVGETALF
jgi:putative aldouronate transport system permease protein